MKLETERLVLRSFVEEDAVDLFEYLREPTVHCFACMKLSDLETAKSAVKERMADDKYYFAIVLKKNGKVIGEIFGHPESSDPEQNDNDTFSPCWMLNSSYQCNGYMYGHCSVLLVSAGQQVKQGQLIAQVGSTGYSTGPHCHFEVMQNGIKVDAMQFFE